MGSGTTTETRNFGNLPLQVLPQFAGFADILGRQAQAAVGLPQLQPRRFAQESVMPIEGLSPLEQTAREFVAQRMAGGIPTPFAEQTAFQQLGTLPQFVGRQVPISAQTQAGLGTAQQTANLFGGTALGQSPAIQAALTGLEETIVPVVQNQAAKAGLAQSGFLPAEVSRAYAQQLVPLYQQGMQMQMQGLQQLRDTQMAYGQTEQAMGTDARLREMQASLQGAPQLQALGQAQTQRDVERLREATSMGQLERDLEQKRREQELQSFLRQRELMGMFYNPIGQLPTGAGQPGSVKVTAQPKNMFGLDFGGK